jgi:hypothetical protein
MLDVDSATPFLIDCGLIDSTSIIHGGLTVRSVLRRNRNLRVEQSDGSGYLIKQTDGTEFGANRTLHAEGEFYTFCRDEPAVAGLAALMPRLAYFDARDTVLAVELVPGAVPLWTHYFGCEVERFPIATCRAIGAALATLHRTCAQPDVNQRSELSGLARTIPWAFTAHRPVPDLLATLSRANYQVLRILQSQEQIAGSLDAARRLWRFETIIHGDIRADNILVTAPDEAPPSVRLVDWELVQQGDPAWDLAGALQDFVLFWTASMPQETDLTADERVAQARYALPVLQAGARSLWRGYRDAAMLNRAESAERLRRAVMFSGVRLIQSAYEIGPELEDLTPQAVTLLQISANLLADPDTGQVQLYGIPPEVIPP